jgi:hypothetical protein
VSKAATEVLLAAAASNELIVKVIRRAQAEVAAVAEQCLSLTLSGRVRDAAEAGTEVARFASGTTHIAGLRRTGRSLGGLIFRR